MSEQDKIQLFENQKIRTAWDTEKEVWYFYNKNFDYPEKPLKYKHIRRISD